MENSKKPHIKQKNFQDRNISSLEAHDKKGSKLASPFSKISGPVNFSSWRDTCLPNILWACLVISVFPREEALDLFRRIIAAAKEGLSDCKGTFITHNHLARLSRDDFQKVFSPILTDEDSRKALSPLLLIESLPDREHWRAFLPEPDMEMAWDALAKAVTVCLDHQSQESTDIRWLKLMYFIGAGWLFFPETMADELENLRLYPSRGDMRSVRPSIRAMEMTTRNFEFGIEHFDKKHKSEIPASKHEEFWDETYQKTHCIVVGFAPEEVNNVEVLKEIVELHAEISEHFYAASTKTSVDVRHEGAFGLVLYGLRLLMEAVRAKNNVFVIGRLALRSIVEVFITLHYLTEKDNETLWAQYRSYGSGQAKLAFLKNIREEDIPSFIDLEKLEVLANEDMWLEFQDIKLGSWSNVNLRQMATDAGCKDVYDKFYDSLSGNVHGHWIAAREASLSTCMNPLHRLHRVPGAWGHVSSIVPDGCKLMNRMLDDLNHLYPSFKRRFRSYKSKPSE